MKIAAAYLIGLAFVGLIIWAVTQPDSCADRQPFHVGGSATGLYGTYCARWR